MGYTTDFNGVFTLDRPLEPEHKTYLAKFSATRRMKRNTYKVIDRPDPIRITAGLPIGDEGGYFVGEEGFAGQNLGEDVLNFNEPPEGQPGLWCQWVPTEDATGIAWDQAEKFYNYVGWLEYIIDHFLKRWGYVLSGEVTWEGEDSGDLGKIIVTNNEVMVKLGRVIYE